MYRTYSYNDMPMPVKRSREEKAPPPINREEVKEIKEDKKEKGLLGGIFENLETDDIILIVVVLVLLIDDCDDKMLLLALAFIFFSEWF